MARGKRPLFGTSYIVLVIIEYLWFFASWLLLVDATNHWEVLFGVVAAGLAVIGLELVRRHHLAKFRPRLRWLLEGLRLPYYIIQGCAVIFWVLLKYPFSGEKSILKSVPFMSGGSDARSCARRALAIAYGTMPPNFVVLSVDLDKQVMLIHQVQPSGVPLMIQNLGAKA
jgi:hypothetical protein